MEMYYLARGRLESVLDTFAVGVPGLMLYYPSRSRSLAKLKAFCGVRTRQNASRLLSLGLPDSAGIFRPAASLKIV